MNGHPRHRKSSVLGICERCREPWPCPTSRATDDAIASLLVRLSRSAADALDLTSQGGSDEREDNQRQTEGSHEEARSLRRMTNSTRAASNGSPRTSDPSEAPSPARAGRVAAGLPPAPAPRSARAGEGFWDHVQRGSDDECWTWTGTRLPDGYGILSRRPTTYAHRMAYELLVGPIGEGLHIDHLCRNTSCVNPAHLEPVTPAENNRRSRPFRTLPDACPKGHPYDEANTYRDRNGWRYCRSCHRAREADAYARQRVG